MKRTPRNKREQLLARLNTAWDELRDSYAGLSNASLLTPGVTGNWSVRDIIAHVTTWEEEALRHLPIILAGRKPPRYSVTYGGIHAFNAQATEKKREFSLGQILRQRDLVHARLIAFIKKAPEDQLGGDTRFRRRLRLDTYAHYSIHARAILNWRRHSSLSLN